MKIKKETMTPEKLAAWKKVCAKRASDGLHKLMTYSNSMARILPEDIDEERIAKFMFIVLDVKSDEYEKKIARFRIKELRGKIDG